jgi:hypothetical protein
VDAVEKMETEVKRIDKEIATNKVCHICTKCINNNIIQSRHTPNRVAVIAKLVIPTPVSHESVQTHSTLVNPRVQTRSVESSTSYASSQSPQRATPPHVIEQQQSTMSTVDAKKGTVEFIQQLCIDYPHIQPYIHLAC